MIRVSMGSNTDRKVDTVDVNTTLRAVLEKNNVDYSRGMTLNGSTVQAGQMDQTFAELGVADGTMNFLLYVAKQDNA